MKLTSATISVLLSAVLSGCGLGGVETANKRTQDNEHGAQGLELVVGATAGERIAKAGGAGYSEIGTWLVTDPKVDAGFGGTAVHYLRPGATGTAERSFGGLPLGRYLVQASWTAASNRATNAPFTLFDDAKQIASV